MNFRAVVPWAALSTGACQVGSGIFGTWVWWLYMVVRDPSPSSALDPQFALQIPGYAAFKLWGSVISPYVLGRSQSSVPPEDDSEKKEPVSKRQEKLRKRSERGDPRVQTRRR